MVTRTVRDCVPPTHSIRYFSMETPMCGSLLTSIRVFEGEYNKEKLNQKYALKMANEPHKRTQSSDAVKRNSADPVPIQASRSHSVSGVRSMDTKVGSFSEFFAFQQTELKKSPDEIPAAAEATKLQPIHTSSFATGTSQPQHEIHDTCSNERSLTLNQVDSNDNFLKMETTDTGTVKSTAAGATCSKIDDNSLLKCCRYIHEKDLKPLAAACSVSTKTFEEMKKEYEDAGANIYAYHLLKKWLSDNPSCSVEKLQKRLRALNHPKAASKLKAEK